MGQNPKPESDPIIIQSSLLESMVIEKFLQTI